MATEVGTEELPNNIMSEILNDLDDEMTSSTGKLTHYDLCPRINRHLILSL